MSDTAEAAFAEALAAFQSELPHIAKAQTAKVPTKAGGSYSYSYADLTDITEAAIPVLCKHGLSWTAAPTLSEHGFVLRYALVHVAGHREGGDYPLPDPSRSSAQEIGSALTYARRYALTAVTGIAPGGDDDDGARAVDARAADPLPRAPRRAGATTRRTAEELGDPSTRPDDWATPTLPVTDVAWLEGFRSRLVACTRPSEVRGLDAEAHVVFADGKLTADDARALKGEIESRLSELTAEPVSA